MILTKEEKLFVRTMRRTNRELVRDSKKQEAELKRLQREVEKIGPTKPEQIHDWRRDEHNTVAEPGVLHVAKEGPSTVKEVTLEEAHDLPGAQIDPGSTAPEDIRTREIAQTACAKCPGFCCLAFKMDWYDPNTIDAEIKADRAALKGAGPEAGWQRDQLESKVFFRDNLKVVNAEKRIYGCKAFDTKARRCTAYERRPSVCKKFICGPALMGHAPSRGMMAHNIPKLQHLIHRKD